MENRPIFVYGTLMLGQRNHQEGLTPLLEKVEKAQIEGELYYYSEGDYPALTKGTRKIKGELFYFNDLPAALEITHPIEEYISEGNENNLYHFEKVTVVNENNEEVEAYVYRINPKQMAMHEQWFSPIKEDCWLTFKKI